MSSHYGGGGGGLLPSHMSGANSNQAQAMMRMLDMSSNGGGGGGGYPQQRSQVSPPDGGLLSTTSPLSSPRNSPPASTPQQSLPPPRPPPPVHLQLPSSQVIGHPKPESSQFQQQQQVSIGSSSSSSLSSNFPSALPIFSSQTLPPDPFTALQDLRLSHPSISQWLQQVNPNSLKPEPVSPRLDQQTNVPPPEYQRNWNDPSFLYTIYLTSSWYNLGPYFWKSFRYL